MKKTGTQRKRNLGGTLMARMMRWHRLAVRNENPTHRKVRDECTRPASSGLGRRPSGA